MNEPEMLAIRRAFAKKIMRASGLEDARLEAALATVPREAFLGEGPWAIMQPSGGYVTTPDSDPVHLYQDALVGMIPQKGLNNGQPSFLAFLISLGRLREGEHAVHIGAGLGYYTAIIARLVGDTGKVTAIEYEQELTIRAKANLAAFPEVRVVWGDGFRMPLNPADVIYVNAGAVSPADTWLDALKNGGRLILPLTTAFTTNTGQAMTKGAVFLIERRDEVYLAEWKCDSTIYPCVGGRDQMSEVALANAFQKGGWEKVTRLYRTDKINDHQCWLRGPGWSLAYS